MALLGAPYIYDISSLRVKQQRVNTADPQVCVEIGHKMSTNSAAAISFIRHLLERRQGREASELQRVWQI